MVQLIEDLIMPKWVMPSANAPWLNVTFHYPKVPPKSWKSRALNGCNAYIAYNTSLLWNQQHWFPGFAAIGLSAFSASQHRITSGRGKFHKEFKDWALKLDKQHCQVVTLMMGREPQQDFFYKIVRTSEQIRRCFLIQPWQFWHAKLWSRLKQLSEKRSGWF